MEEKRKINYTSIIAIVIVAIILIGATFAYFTSSDTFTNIFNAGSYSTEVKEVFESPSNWTPGTTTPKEVTVKNTGNVCEHARVSFTEEWTGHGGATIANMQNGNKAALINFDNTSDWIKVGNYYYYNKDITNGDETSSFIESVTFNPLIKNDYTCTQSGNNRDCVPNNNTYVNGHYRLVINVETIQCDASESVWGVDVTDLTEPAVFAPGPVVNVKMKSLAAGESVDIWDSDSSITAFVRANALPSGFVPSVDNTISASTNDYRMRYTDVVFDEYGSLSECERDLGLRANYNQTFSCVRNSSTGTYDLIMSGYPSEKIYPSLSACEYEATWDPSSMSCVQLTNSSAYPIYAWYDNGTIYFYSEAENIAFNENSTYFFGNLGSLANISSLANIETYNISEAAMMFAECTGITSLQSLASWDTLNVNDMGSMFADCAGLTSLQPLASWDTSNVIIMAELFCGCTGLSSLQGLEDWDVSNVIDMSYLFEHCTITTLQPIIDWDTSSVRIMTSAFNDCGNITSLQSLADWDVSNVKNMNDIFEDCISLTTLQGLEDWDVSSVIDMQWTFSHCESLTTLQAIADWDVSNVDYFMGTFAGCYSLTTLQGLEDWDMSNAISVNQMFSHCTSLTSANAINSWVVSNVSYSEYGFYQMFNGCSVHPTFTNRAGTWDSNGSFVPTA